MIQRIFTVQRNIFDSRAHLHVFLDNYGRENPRNLFFNHYFISLSMCLSLSRVHCAISYFYFICCFYLHPYFAINYTAQSVSFISWERLSFNFVHRIILLLLTHTHTHILQCFLMLICHFQHFLSFLYIIPFKLFSV